jgi:hypothetical protein
MMAKTPKLFVHTSEQSDIGWIGLVQCKLFLLQGRKGKKGGGFLFLGMVALPVTSTELDHSYLVVCSNFVGYLQPFLHE